MIKQIKEYMRKRKEFIELDRINFKAEHYKPKYNNKKRFSIGALIVFCFATAGTNWLLVVPKMISKYKPLWVFE